MYRHQDRPLAMLLSQREQDSLPSHVVSQMLPQIAGCWESIWKSTVIRLFHFCTLPQPSAFDHRPWCAPKELPPVGGITSVKFGCQEQDVNPSPHKKARKCAAEKLSLSLRLPPALGKHLKVDCGLHRPSTTMHRLLGWCPEQI